MSELKPCPFCGSEDIGVRETYCLPKFSKKSLPDFVYVGCDSCGVGYQEETEQEAIKAWNTRPTRQQMSADELEEIVADNLAEHFKDKVIHAVSAFTFHKVLAEAILQVSDVYKKEEK